MLLTSSCQLRKVPILSRYYICCLMWLELTRLSDTLWQMCGHKKLICCHLLLKQYPKILSLFQIGICLASVDWLKPVFSYSLLSWDKTFKNIFSLYILIFFHWHSYGTCLLKCKVNDSRRGLCLVIFKG